MPPVLAAPSGVRLSLEEREEIWFGRSRGHSLRQIAARLGRAPSTVSRELRNAGRGGYRPSTAQRIVDQRRARPKPRKLAINGRLRDYVQTGLEADRSPEQIMLRLRRDFPHDPEMRVSHETIYQALYVEGRGGVKRELQVALRTGRTLRRPRGRGREQRRSRADILEMVSIADRPAEVEGRLVPGHWEGDLIVGKDSGSAIGTLVERTTGFVMLLHLPTKHGAAEVRDQMITAIGKMPEMLRKSVTWDQGIEMASHKQISIATGIEIYFCDPHSPWQRGSNENTNGLLRQYFPKGQDLSVFPADYLDYIADKLNNRPRKRLDAMTPREALDELLSASLTGGVAPTT
ncbi:MULTISPECIES: IS30 family transposase [unclassified Curtobacterium]|uniref:IS30 family transposase n=1 Tax=unclassified Curtobacterium TaxID=257496 RepID=UPI001045A9FE|nr:MULTISPECIES: IS30 family transposase [unclassified Curtobacterium]